MKMFSASEEHTKELDQERVKQEAQQYQQHQKRQQQQSQLADLGQQYYGSKTISYERNSLEARGDDSILEGIHGKSISYDCKKELAMKQGGQMRYAGGDSQDWQKNSRQSEFSRNRKLVQKSSITAGFMSSSKKEENNNRQSRNWIYDSIKKEGFEMLENRRNQQIITDGHSSSGLKLTDLIAESYQKSTKKANEDPQQMILMNKENLIDYQLKNKNTNDSRDLSQKNVGESIEFMRKWRSITRGEEMKDQQEELNCLGRKITEERLTTTIEDLKDTLPRNEEILTKLQGQTLKGDTVVSMEWSEQKNKGQIEEKPYSQMMRLDGDIVIKDINTSRVRKSNSEEKQQQQQSDCWMNQKEQNMKLDINSCKQKLNIQDKQEKEGEILNSKNNNPLNLISAVVPLPSHIYQSCNNTTCRHEKDDLKLKLAQEELKVEQLTRLLKECQSDREAWRQQLRTIDSSNSKLVSTQIELEQLTHTLAQEKYTINKLQSQILALQAQNEQLHKINVSCSSITNINNKNSSIAMTTSIGQKKMKDIEDNNIQVQVVDKGIKDNQDELENEGKNNNNNNNAVYTFASDDGEYTLGPSALRSLDRNPVELINQQRNSTNVNGQIRGRDNQIYERQQQQQQQPLHELPYSDNMKTTDKRYIQYESSFGQQNLNYPKNIPQVNQIEQSIDQTNMKHNIHQKNKNYSYDLRSPLSPVSLSNYASANTQQNTAPQQYPKSLNGSYYKYPNDENNNNHHHHPYLLNSSKSPQSKQDVSNDLKKPQYIRQASSSSSSFYSNYDKNLYMQPALASDIAAKRLSGYELYTSNIGSSNGQSRRPFRNSFYY